MKSIITAALAAALSAQAEVPVHLDSLSRHGSETMRFTVGKVTDEYRHLFWSTSVRDLGSPPEGDYEDGDATLEGLAIRDNWLEFRARGDLAAWRERLEGKSLFIHNSMDESLELEINDDPKSDGGYAEVRGGALRVRHRGMEFFSGRDRREYLFVIADSGSVAPSGIAERYDPSDFGCYYLE